MWKVTANGEVDVDDHSKEDLDVSNLFSIVNAFYFILRSLFCLCVSCWFPISCLTFYRKMSLHCGARKGIAQILNMCYWPNVRWLDVGQEFCVLINQDEVVVIKHAENLGQYTASCPNKLYRKRNYYMAKKITFSCGANARNPERATRAHLIHSGSQSERRIRFIFPLKDSTTQ